MMMNAYGGQQFLHWINEITKKEFENIFKKIKHEDKDFSLHKRDWENFEQNNESIALNVIFSSQDINQNII